MESETGDFDYNVITQANFDTFRISPAHRAIVHQPDPTPPPTAPPTTTLSSSHPSIMYSPVAMFRRSIKKDPSLFPTLKDDKYHDVWHRSFNTQAVAQDVSEVLDEKYVPVTVDDIALFSEKTKYIYAVLEREQSANS